MAEPQLEDFADLIKSVRTARPLGRWTNATSDLQKYHALPHIMKKKNVKMIPTYACEWDINMSTAGNARSSSELESDSVKQSPTVQRAIAYVRHQQTSYTFTKGQMMANGGGSKNEYDAQRLWDFVQKERGNAWVDLADLVEDTFWGYPTTTDTVTPYGLLYGVVYSSSGTSAADGVGGFNGTVPGSHTTVYNVNPTTYPRHANWSHRYTNVTRDDLIYKIKLGAYKTGFEPPIRLPVGNQTRNMVFYTNWSVSNSLTNKLEDRNENLGTDFDVYGGRAHFKSAPVEVVSKLDSDTGNPVFQVDWNALDIICLRGFHFNETEPQRNMSKHLVMEVHVDLTWGVKIEDRRRFAAYSTSA